MPIIRAYFAHGIWIFSQKTFLSCGRKYWVTIFHIDELNFNDMFKSCCLSDFLRDSYYYYFFFSMENATSIFFSNVPAQWILVTITNGGKHDNAMTNSCNTIPMLEKDLHCDPEMLRTKTNPESAFKLTVYWNRCIIWSYVYYIYILSFQKKERCVAQKRVCHPLQTAEKVFKYHM